MFILLKNKFKSIIAKKLVFYILLASSIITSVFTSISFYIDYKNEMSGMTKMYSQVENSFLTSLSDALWVMEPTQIEFQLEGILKFHDIFRVKVKTKSEGVIYSREEQNISENVLLFSNKKTFSLVSGSHDVGTLEIEASTFYMYTRLVKKALFFFVTQGLKTLIVSMMIFFIFEYFVNQHLYLITQQLQTNQAKNQHTGLVQLDKLDVGDELDYLIESLNSSFFVIEDMDREKDSLISMLKEQSKYKTDFLENMSHELRTPLNAILGFTELLEDDGEQEKKEAYLRQISTSGKLLLGIINDVLDFSKLNTQKFILYPVPGYIEYLLLETIAQMKPSAEKKGLILDGEYCDDISYLVDIDPAKFQQIFQNIISNAIKYTKDGHIMVQIYCSEVGEQINLRVKISDTGIGMTRETRELIFSSFSQGNSTLTKEIEGTGIGLSITKSLCRLMGGDVYVESVEGVGTTFNVDLSFERKFSTNTYNKPASLPTAIKPCSYEHLKILVVEDNIVNQKLVCAQLKKIIGYKPDIANDGVEALELLENQNYNFVFMDISMPRKDGMETTKEIRLSRHSSSDLYIVALTANAVHGDREKYLSIGMDDYISKPASSKSLKRVLDHNSIDQLIQKVAS